MNLAILKFSDQLKFKPKVQIGDDVPNNKEGDLLQYKYRYGKLDTIYVCGMGGSHLAADMLNELSNITYVIHSDYGLPQPFYKTSKPDMSHSMIMFFSYSGNTEETVDAFNSYHGEKSHALVITTGGQLLDSAIANSVPYIKLPAMGIQPRSALGLCLKALTYGCGEHKLYGTLQNAPISEVDDLIKKLMGEGLGLAKEIDNRVPVIYTSNRHKSVGYNWKIKFNETGKIPAFCNVIPELNHNEMQGFYEPNNNFIFIFLVDGEDHPMVIQRMRILKEQLICNKGYRVVEFSISNNVFSKIYSTILADWTAYYIASLRGVDPETVPTIENFKKELENFI